MSNHSDADVILIGGGIMSATLGSMLAILQPEWKILLLEQHGDLAQESSGAWNNAGTGHSGYCELNYMPDPTDGARARQVAQEYRLTREWWGYLVQQGLVEPADFIHATPHINVVFGETNVDYLRQRFETLSREPAFAQMEFTEDPEVIAQWAPLMTEGRPGNQPIAATRVENGTDVDFGALTRQLSQIIEAAGGQVRCGHQVRDLTQTADGQWVVRGRRGARNFTVTAPFIFVGAGGHALRLLQKAAVPEVHGYAVLPVGAAFLRCSDPQVAARHQAKVYGQAAVGAPPMSVPHLDHRLVDGVEHLMFGPYATFSTKLLKHGQWTDFFRTLTWNNLSVITAALAQNGALIRYLIKQLAAGHKQRFSELKQYYPQADPEQWELILAGQRAQLVTPDAHDGGALQHGTELVISSGGSIAGLLGASPGASTAVPTMLALLQQCFPRQWASRWSSAINAAIPLDAGVHDGGTAWDADRLQASEKRTGRALGLKTM